MNLLLKRILRPKAFFPLCYNQLTSRSTNCNNEFNLLLLLLLLLLGKCDEKLSDACLRTDTAMSLNKCTRGVAPSWL